MRNTDIIVNIQLKGTNRTTKMDSTLAVAMFFWIITGASSQEDKFISLYAHPNIPIGSGQEVKLVCTTTASELPYFIRLDRADPSLALLYARQSDMKIQYSNGQAIGWVEFKIEESTAEDTGNYTCEARWYTSYTEIRKAEYRLEVLGIKLHGPPEYPRPGDNVTLTCNTTSNPLPDHIWLQKSGQDLVHLTKDKLENFTSANGEISWGLEYKMEAVTSEEIGDYVCIAHWALPKPIAQRSRYRLEVPIVSMAVEPIVVMYGTEVTLICSGTSLRLPSQMGIDRHGKTVAIDMQRNLKKTSGVYGQMTGSIYYTLSNVTLSDDGDYYCIGLWFSPYAYRSYIYTLNVTTPVTLESMEPRCNNLHPFYTLEDLTIKLTVSGNNIGQAWYYWYSPKGETVVRPTNGSKSITRSVITGNFLYGQTQAVVFRFKLEGESESLSCENVTYFNGRYRFIVLNENGEIGIEEEYDIDVHYPAMWKGGMRNISMKPGDQDVTITCDVCSKPLAAFSWTLNGEDLPDDVILSQSGASIVIQEVEMHHLGIYRCTAVNTIEGRIYSRVFDLEVGRDSTLSEHQATDLFTPTTYYIIGGFAIFLIAIILVVCLAWRHFKKKGSEGTQKANAELTWKPGTLQKPPQKPDIADNWDLKDPEAVGDPASLYANAGQMKGDHHSNIYADPIVLNRKPSTVKIVQDGVMYSDIQILPAPSEGGTKPSTFIHGAEDKVDYACIDWDRST